MQKIFSDVHPPSQFSLNLQVKSEATVETVAKNSSTRSDEDFLSQKILYNDKEFW